MYRKFPNYESYIITIRVIWFGFYRRIGDIEILLKYLLLMFEGICWDLWHMRDRTVCSLKRIFHSILDLSFKDRNILVWVVIFIQGVCHQPSSIISISNFIRLSLIRSDQNVWAQIIILNKKSILSNGTVNMRLCWLYCKSQRRTKHAHKAFRTRKKKSNTTNIFLLCKLLI